jgi:energy-coupling factor transporter ATP-binding protein EcfA2
LPNVDVPSPVGRGILSQPQGALHMYLQEVFVENIGALQRLSFRLPFKPDGSPKPLVLVGPNGSGKTTLLSIVADALFEGAAQHYSDVVSSAPGLSRHWFRVVGPGVTTAGAPGSCAMLRFEHQGASLYFKEKSGALPVAELKERAPQSLREAIDWSDNGEPLKAFPVSAAQAKEVFEECANAFFPANRSEVPNWLNTNSLIADPFDLRPNFKGNLRRPIYIERAFDQIHQWLLGLLLDSRTDFSIEVVDQNGKLAPKGVVVGDWQRAMQPKNLWGEVNSILRTVLDDQNVRLGWGQRNNKALVIVRGNVSTPLNSLSAGQSGLFNLFGTLLRYGDMAGAPAAGGVKGICLIDELDAHMHVDLQHRALPLLIKMFPGIQFIISSHSPLFVLGLEKELGADNVAIVDMPAATPIQAEAFSEFERALAILRGTIAFNESLAGVAVDSGKTLVLLEGETDPIYLIAAAELLGRNALLDTVEFQWVGAKQEVGGQAFNTGKSALNAAFNLYRAKPQLLNRTVLLLFDNDAHKASQDFGNLHVRSMPTNAANTVIEEGIENALPPDVAEEAMYDTTHKKTPGGGSTTIRTLNKMRLCKRLCEDKRDPAHFARFAAILDLVQAVVELKP